MAREIDLYKIGSTPEELQSALVALRSDFDAHNHDGSSSRSFETLHVQTISAETILIRKTSYADAASGIWMGIVNNVMKLKLGTGSSFLSWDGTTLSISGTITATAGTIGGFTISSTALTGGLIQTAATGNHVAMTGSTGSFDIYGVISATTYLIGSIRPNLATIYVGPQMIAYKTGDGSVRSMVKSAFSDTNGSGGDVSALSAVLSRRDLPHLP